MISVHVPIAITAQCLDAYFSKAITIGAPAVMAKLLNGITQSLMFMLLNAKGKTNKSVL